MRTLLFPDPAEGAGAPGDLRTESDVAPAAPSAHSPAPAAPAAPPAAATVIEGTVTEETLRLRAEKDELAKKLKDRETEVATVTDNFNRYKTTVETGTTIPVKKAPAHRPITPFGYLRKK